MPKHYARKYFNRPLLTVGLLLAGLLALLAAVVPTAQHRASAAVKKPATAAGKAATPPVFAYYYLWWSANHWNNLLGPHYPTTAATLPLPARLNANGCSPVSNYAGNQLTDVPQKIYTQDDPNQVMTDVREAASAGLTGFAVNWAGSGQANQNASSTPYSKRLQTLVNVVHTVNAQGIPFKLWLSYKASAVLLSASQINADLGYIQRTYGNDPAFDKSQSSKLTVIWQGSRKYPTSTLSQISSRYRSSLRIIGDETNWSTNRAPYLDGDAYYWSSQDPYGNPQSFQQLAALAAKVRASAPNPDGSRKVWVAPFTPGYDKQLSGGHNCVPRDNGQTMIKLFDGNIKTNPDAFGLISWNEISEGTYVAPMTRYGNSTLNTLHTLITNGG